MGAATRALMSSSVLEQCLSERSLNGLSSTQHVCKSVCD